MLNNLAKQYFSLQAFFIGLGIVAILYALLFSYVGLKAGDTLYSMEQRLASQSLKIKRAGEVYMPEDYLDANAGEQNGEALPPPPANDLFESSEFGPLPKISESGITPFNAYKRPFGKSGQPFISIVIDGFGLSAENSSEILKELPADITLALSPYAKQPDEWQVRARNNGFETWMSVPTGTKNYPFHDPGTKALLSDAGPKYNKDSLEWIMSRAGGYAGLMLQTDYDFIDNPLVLNYALGEVQRRGLGLFESNPNSPAVARRFAEKEGLPYIRNNIFVSETSLKALEKIARQQGFVVAVVPPYPSYIKGLKIWTNTLEAKGFTLAPLSAITTLNPFIDTSKNQ